MSAIRTVPAEDARALDDFNVFGASAGGRQIIMLGAIRARAIVQTDDAEAELVKPSTAALRRIKRWRRDFAPLYVEGFNKRLWLLMESES